MAKAKAKKGKTKRPTALKRDITNNKKRLINKAFKSHIRTAITSFNNAVAKKADDAALQQALNTVYSLMDKGVKRGLFQVNKASRTKSRLAAKLSQKAS